MAVIHYIHNNVIHHHLTDAYDKWLFSSYTAIIQNSPTKVQREAVLEWFGSKEIFIQYHLENVNYNKIKAFVVD